MSIKVAVRVRPFNQRELNLNSPLCIKMVNNSTILVNESKKERVFSFDYSFWSHDSFYVDENGINIPEKNSNYIDQTKLYDLIGKDIFDNIWDGFNCCLFAYGQTGAGKSYSMVGYGKNKGLIPIINEQIWEKMNKFKDSNEVHCELNFSMVEIYNEKIQDLLIDVNKRPKGGLKIRENKTLGTFIDGMTKYPIESYKEIEDKMNLGSKHRTLAATLMNESSSRAHTIICLELRQIKEFQEKKTECFSNIFLVDLAGSEKVSKTGATGDRLKECCAINKSLTVLGNVISVLAEKEMGKAKDKVVPFRESSLTKILKSAFGGNSKTFMICAISPCLDNYDESLSTLRYADQAKKIKCKAIKNESQTDRIIRELKEENDLLKKKLQQLAGNKLLDAKEQINANKNQLNDFIQKSQVYLDKNPLAISKMNFSQIKLQPKKKELNEIKEDYSIPHLLNLNEDPLLNKKLYFNLVKLNNLKIGRKSKKVNNDINLQAVGILEEHAVIKNNDGNIYIKVLNEFAGDNTFVNGLPVKDKIELYHLDRIIFGTTTTFLIKNPEKEREDGEKEENIDWEYCQLEVQRLQEKQLELEKLEFENQLKNEYEKEKKIIEDKLNLQKNNYDEIINNLNNKLENDKNETEENMQKNLLEKNLKEIINQIKENNINKEKEFDKELKNIKENEYFLKAKINIKKKLLAKLNQFYPLIKEANLISEELYRTIEFKISIIYNYINNFENISNDSIKNWIYIKVLNSETGNIYQWDLDKFLNRFDIMKELINDYFENFKLPNPKNDIDPFWDPQEFILIGKSYILLNSLAYLFELENQISIASANEILGNLKIKIVPLDENEKRINLEESGEEFDDPFIIEGRNLSFKILINEINLNKKFMNKKIKVNFNFGPKENEIYFVSEEIIIKNEKQLVNINAKIDIKNISKNYISYLLDNNFIINITSIDYETIDKIGKKKLDDAIFNIEKKIKNNKDKDALINELNQSIFENKINSKNTKKPNKNKKDENCIIF